MITLPAGTLFRSRTRRKAYVPSAVPSTGAGPAGAGGISGGGAPPAEPGSVLPEPGAVEPGITGAGAVVHGALEEPEPVAFLFGAEGFERDPRLCLWWDFFSPWDARQWRWRFVGWQARAAWEERWGERLPGAAIAMVASAASARQSPPSRSTDRAARDIVISLGGAVRTKPLRGSPGRLRSGTTVRAASSTSRGSPRS